MDMRDPELRQELDRRLHVIETDEAEDVAHAPLSAGTLWTLVLVVALVTVVGLTLGIT